MMIPDNPLEAFDAGDRNDETGNHDMHDSNHAACGNHGDRYNDYDHGNK